MNKKQRVSIVSVSALAAGMAQGAVNYSGVVNTTITASENTSFDLNGDGIPDFELAFNSSNANKPYIEGFPDNAPGSTPLAVQASDGWYGLPVTQFGTNINASYLTPVPDTSPGTQGGQAYLNQDNNSTINTIGGWGVNSLTEGYVGLEMYDNSGGSITNFGWVRLIYSTTAKTLTLVDYAYETTPGEGIVAGATNEVGAPDIYVGPASQTNGIGATVQFSVVALASPAPTYQWAMGPASGSGPYTNLSDGGMIAGSATSTLTLTGVVATNAGDYVVTVSNSLGHITSSAAKLTLVAPTVTPVSPVVLFGGLTAHFNVSGAATGYQWQHAGTNVANNGRISGAQTSSLTISNLQAADAGNYDAVLNVGAPVTSSVSSLTVLPVNSESMYDEAVLAAGPVAYYRFAESGNPATNNLLALDNAGAYNGIYGVDVTNAFDGAVGPRPTNGYPGFAANNSAAVFTPNDTNSQITVDPWNLNTDTATFTFWANPAAIQSYSTAILWTGTNSSAYAGINYYYDQGTGVGVPGNVDLGYTWNEGGSAAYFFWDSGIMPPTTNWSMVALVIVPSNTTLYVYNDDEANTWTNTTGAYPPAVNLFPGDNGIFPFTNEVMSFDTPETIGNNLNVAGGTEGFNGTIANMAVFNQALTQIQLTAMYNAALGVPPGPSIALVNGSVQISWPLGILMQSTNLQGPWTVVPNATSPYTVPAGSPNGFYRVWLSP